jgi:hypothetical protein
MPDGSYLSRIYPSEQDWPSEHDWRHKTNGVLVRINDYCLDGVADADPIYRLVTPFALQAVRRLDELFEIERAISGMTPQQRVVVRQAKSKPHVADLEVWWRRKS